MLKLLSLALDSQRCPSVIGDMENFLLPMMTMLQINRVANWAWECTLINRLTNLG